MVKWARVESASRVEKVAVKYHQHPTLRRGVFCDFLLRGPAVRATSINKVGYVPLGTEYTNRNSRRPFKHPLHHRHLCSFPTRIADLAEAEVKRCCLFIRQ